MRVWVGEARRLCAAALLAPCLGSTAQAAEPTPQHIVSLNLCADELILRLADRAQVAAVTWLARDPRGSTVSAQAAGVPATRGLSEEIVALKPDLVIAGAFTTRTTVGMVKRIGLPVMELGLPMDFEGVRAQIRQVAQAVGRPERGEAMIAEFDARLAAIPVPAAGPPPRALVMRPNAFTVAPGTLGDAILSAGGLANAGAAIGQDRSGAVPLEAAALADPDLIVLDEAAPGTPSLADTLLRHPVLRAFAEQGRTVSIPNRLWTCPGPQVAEVVERLAAVRVAHENHADAAHPPSPRTHLGPARDAPTLPKSGKPDFGWGEGRAPRVGDEPSPQGDGDGARAEKSLPTASPHRRLPPRFGDDEVAEALSPSDPGPARDQQAKTEIGQARLRAGRGDARLGFTSP